jgi:hypothetical protein
MYFSDFKHITQLGLIFVLRIVEPDNNPKHLNQWKLLFSNHEALFLTIKSLLRKSYFVI